MKRVLSPLAAACLLAMAAPQASAAAYSGMVVFGDSLSDAGQFSIGLNPVRFTTQLGPTYNFAGAEPYGSTSPMLINQLLGLSPQVASTSPLRQALGQADGNNWAVGGYTTQQIYNSITQPGGSVVASGGVPLRTRDGYLTGGRVVDSNTLFYVNGGGNDFLQGLVVSDPTARAAAGRLANSVRALSAAGGRYFMVPLLVDAPSPSTGGLFNPAQYALAQSFNSELVSQLGSIDAEIIPLNVPLLYREVLANPGLYGFDASQNLLATCFYSVTITGATGCGNATWGAASGTPNPDKLIYADLVHPTTAMQRILADQGFSILAAPWEISLLPEAGNAALRASQDQLRSQWQADWGDWQAVGQWRGFVGATGQRQNFDKADTSASGDGNSLGLYAGGSYRLDEQWRVGAGLNIQQQQLELGARNSEYDLRSYLASAFAQYHDGLVWFDGTFSAGYLDYSDLERRFSMGITTRTEDGDTDGYVAALGGRLGVELGVSDTALKISPFISADYAYLMVNGYSERGGSSTALSYDDQRRESQRLGVGVQARYQFSEATALYGEISREKEFGDDSSEVSMQVKSVPGLEFDLKGYVPDDRLTRLGLGFQHRLAEGLALRGAYSYRHAANDNLHGANLSVVFDW